MSAAAMSPSPPARAGPPTRATTGFGRLPDRGQDIAQPAGRHAVAAGSAAAVSLRSAPEQKTGPVWVRTITRTASSATPRRARDQLVDQRGGEGVAVVRAVQREGGDAGRGGPRHASGRYDGHAGQTSGMASNLPEGEPVPGRRRAAGRGDRGGRRRGFGVYVHVPFCASRCGYCDFNTYTAAELGGGLAGDGYADAVLAEMALAARVLGPGRRGSTRCSSAVAPRRCSRPATSAASSTGSTDLGPRRRRRGHHRGQPGVGRPRASLRRCGRPASPASRSACSRPRRTCSPSSTAGTRRAGRPPPPGRRARPGSSTSTST